MDYQLIIKTDERGRPRIDGYTGQLPPDATFTVTGSEDEDTEPWGRIIVVNDVIIDTGAVTGVRVGARHSDAPASETWSPRCRNHGPGRA